MVESVSAAELTAIEGVLPQFGLEASRFSVERIGSGHINRTYYLRNKPGYILQSVNIHVFQNPEAVAGNIRLAADYLKEKHPDYLFLAPIPTVAGLSYAYNEQRHPWRLFPYFENSCTINEAARPQQAYEAARAFGQLASNLSGCSLASFQYTIPQFHHLELRYRQFQEALANASVERKDAAEAQVNLAIHHHFLVERYQELISSGELVLRIFHNDTKINNVLFDTATENTLAVIDLDTLMPGYFIYDLGDLIRTLVSPVSEEEKDISAIRFRADFYDAVVSGYLSAMKTQLTHNELHHISFAGPMMTYIMALRFLADYLRGDTYYHIKYPTQNLVRATNQLKLLEVLLQHKPLD